jgi:hypothetical protein
MSAPEPMPPRAGNEDQETRMWAMFLHLSLFINFTISNFNKNELEDSCSCTDGIEQIRGTFFYFHTPDYGRDELYIEPEERSVILRKLLADKRRCRMLAPAPG